MRLRHFRSTRDLRETFYVRGAAHKDLSASEEVTAAIKHTVEVNKESIVDMDTFQFN